jgi:hypothetical protein
LDYKVEAFEFGSCIRRRELPVDALPSAVTLLRPGLYLSLECFDISDASVETLAASDTEFDLGPIEPGTVLGRVVEIESLG